MKFNHTLSAILRDHWLIDEEYVNNNIPLLISLMDGTAIMDGEKSPVCFSKSLESTSSTDWKAQLSNEVDTPSILRLDINGPILKYGGMCSYGTMDYIDWIKDAEANENIGGILLMIDSPGGQASGVELLREAIAATTKPIVSQISGKAASAAAYSIITADKIFTSSKVDQFGSLGGMVSWRDYSKRMEAMGIKTFTEYAAQSTEKNIEAREAQKGNMKPLREQLTYLIEVHHQAVMDARGLEGEDLPWMTGKMFFAEKAQELGLIDGIQSLDETIKYLSNLISNSNTSDSMSFLNKHPKLSALAGVPEADLTEEQINDANAELDERKVEAVRVVPASYVAEADDAIAQKNLAIKAQKDAEAAQLKAEQDRDSWKAKAEAYGKQPGAKPTATQKANETVVEQSGTKIISQTDKELAELQGKTFTISD